MILTHPLLAADLERLRAVVPTNRQDMADRAIGDNFAFEENIGDERRDEFQDLRGAAPALQRRAAQYFAKKVEGGPRGHLPSTFAPINHLALMSGIEGNQAIIRLEMIEGFFTAHPPVPGGDTVETRLTDATKGPLIRWLNGFSGERPAFGCFKSEVKSDLKKEDWLIRLVRRLGLGHWEPAAGQSLRFALMEYSVDEVLKQARSRGVDHPFAKPTVLDSRNSPFFFPAPKSSKEGFAADLDPAVQSKGIREFLHIRLDYDPKHVMKIKTLSGPIEHPPLNKIRNAHLTRIRQGCGRDDFGSEMP